MELRFTLAQKQLLHLNQIVNRLHPTKMMINKVDAPRRRIAKSFSDDFIIYLVDDVLKKTLPEAYDLHIENRQFLVRWNASCPMELMRSLIVQAGAN